jgi:hypothetical protein
LVSWQVTHFSYSRWPKIIRSLLASTLADVLQYMGLIQSKGESNIWMRERNGLYKYFAVYVDDLFRESGGLVVSAW